MVGDEGKEFGSEFVDEVPLVSISFGGEQGLSLGERGGGRMIDGDDCVSEVGRKLLKEVEETSCFLNREGKRQVSDCWDGDQIRRPSPKMV